MERLQSIITTITWGIMPFIIAAFVELIWLITRKGSAVWNDKVFVGLISALFLRYVGSRP